MIHSDPSKFNNLHCPDNFIMDTLLTEGASLALGNMVDYQATVILRFTKV